MYEHILDEVEEGVALITLNRPDNFNAFVERMNGELTEAVKKAGKDASVRVIVLTGSGKAFCSGQDLKEIKDLVGDRNLAESVERRYNPMIQAIHQCPKPVICRMNRVAAGAGCSLALACDMIIASEKAWLIEAFVHVPVQPARMPDVWIVGFISGAAHLLDERDRFPVQANIYHNYRWAIGSKAGHQVSLSHFGIERQEVSIAVVHRFGGDAFYLDGYVGSQCAGAA